MVRAAMLAALLLAACSEEPQSDPSNGLPDDSVPVGQTPPLHATPLVTSSLAAPDGGLDTVTITSNAPIRPGSIDVDTDITLEDLNSTSVFAKPADVVYHGTAGLTVDFLYDAGTLIGGHVYQLSVSAAHLSDYFGGKLKADFVGTFTAPFPPSGA